MNRGNVFANCNTFILSHYDELEVVGHLKEKDISDVIFWRELQNRILRVSFQPSGHCNNKNYKIAVPLRMHTV